MPDQNAIEVQGGIREQGTDEIRIWSIDVASVASTPAAPAIVRMVDEDVPATDIAATSFPSGTTTVSGTVITLKPLVGTADLVAGHGYRIYITFTDSGNTVEVFVRLWVPVENTTKVLVTVPMCLEYMETDSPGSRIQRLIDWADDEVVVVAGVHPISGDRTETLVGGERLLFLPEPAATITSITETVGTTDTVLATDDYRIWDDGRYLERLANGTNSRGTWGHPVVVVYAGTNNNARRRDAILQLVELSLNRQPGIKSQRVGDYSQVNTDFQTDVTTILRAVIANYAGGGMLV